MNEDCLEQTEEKTQQRRVKNKIRRKNSPTVQKQYRRQEGTKKTKRRARRKTPHEYLLLRLQHLLFGNQPIEQHGFARVDAAAVGQLELLEERRHLLAGERRCGVVTKGKAGKISQSLMKTVLPIFVPGIIIHSTGPPHVSTH